MHTRHLRSFGLVLLGAVGAVLIIAIANTAAENDEQQIRVLSDEPVAGLRDEATVYFRGVAVGGVRAIRFNPENPMQLWIETEISSELPVTDAMHATLVTDHHSGEAALELLLTSTNTTPTPVSQIPLRAGELDSLTGQAMAALQQIHGVVEELEPAIDRFRTRTTPAVHAILSSVRDSARALQDFFRDISQPPPEFLPEGSEIES